MWDPNTRDPEYLTWLRAQDFPIYMWEKETDIPCSVAYPYDKIVEKYGHEGKPYLTSTFAYMLAMAIEEKPDRIEIYGIDLVAEEEYRYQRAGTEYLIGFAKGLGIEIYLPDLCPLLKAPPYGKYGFAEARTLWTEQQLSDRTAALQQQQAKLMSDLNAVQGAIQENNNWRHLHLSQRHSTYGVEHKPESEQFAGIDTVQDGAKVPTGVESDGHNMGHTGMLETMVV